jgi:hypothetical protein
MNIFILKFNLQGHHLEPRPVPGLQIALTLHGLFVEEQ